MKAIDRDGGLPAPAPAGRSRLRPPFGSVVDRNTSVRFTFDGKLYYGLSGDSLASALAANEVRLLSRSFKYHRPRGPVTMAGLDANTYVRVGDQPNVAADTVPIAEGLAAWPQNVFGSIRCDFASAIEWIGRFLPVGFYYKAFFRPRRAWRFWEPLFRRISGLGTLRIDVRPEQRCEAVHLHADVAIIGAGPAGISAAVAAAEAGAEVILIEADNRLGGSLLHSRFGADGWEGPTRAAQLVDAVRRWPTLRVLTGAVCTGWFSDNLLAVLEKGRLCKVRARDVVVATGALEQPAVFRNNDLPGIMLGSAAQRLMRLYGVAPGTRAAILTANRFGYEVALDFLEAGIEVAAIVEMRSEQAALAELALACGKGLRVICASTVVEALRGRDRRCIGKIRVAAISGPGLTSAAVTEVVCDTLAVCVGYAPLAHLLCHAGGRLIYDEALATLAISDSPGHAFLAGAVDGVHDLDEVLIQGADAGRTAALSDSTRRFARRYTRTPVSHPWPIFPHPKGKEFVDLDEDVQIADVLNAVTDRFEHVELVKRYTTAGMGPSQGRMTAANLVRLVARAVPQAGSAVAVTTQRPPFVPESVAALAGQALDPVRRTPMHRRHVALGAKMIAAGSWLRPAHYGSSEARDEIIRAEVCAVRQAVGIIDVSTLGSLEIRGPDAALFLERFYTGTFGKQAVGRTRYVLALDETGSIIDDGVACRLAVDHYYVTATTSGVDASYRMMGRMLSEWRLDVDLTNVTAAWAGVTIAGPSARSLLSGLPGSIDFSRDAFPFLAIREGTLAGMPVRVMRVGFVGELAFEIHVPASLANSLWERLEETGRRFGLRPVGVEAQRLLRLEKGHIIVGQDTDGLSTPREAGLDWAVKMDKSFFIGQRAIAIRNSRPASRRLVGFTLPLSSPVPPECVLVIREGAIVGRVTSCARSEACNAVIGLAYVHPADASASRPIFIKLEDGRMLQATVAVAPFFDPENERQSL